MPRIAQKIDATELSPREMKPLISSPCVPTVPPCGRYQITGFPLKAYINPDLHYSHNQLYNMVTKYMVDQMDKSK